MLLFSIVFLQAYSLCSYLIHQLFSRQHDFYIHASFFNCFSPSIFSMLMSHTSIVFPSAYSLYPCFRLLWFRGRVPVLDRLSGYFLPPIHTDRPCCSSSRVVCSYSLVLSSNESRRWSSVGLLASDTSCRQLLSNGNNYKYKKIYPSSRHNDAFGRCLSYVFVVLSGVINITSLGWDTNTPPPPPQT